MKDICRHLSTDEELEDSEDDCSQQGGVAGSKQALRHRRKQLMADHQVLVSCKHMEGNSNDKTGLHCVSDATAQDTVIMLSKLSMKTCAHCNRGGKLMVCTRCKSAYYCSKEHQRAHWLNAHKEDCRAPGSEATTVALAPVQTSDKPLGLEMIELLDLFRSVHKDMPEENKEHTLRKVIHVCEQIIRRGNPDNIPIPQVFYMLQEARQMLRPFKLELEGICEPDEGEPEPKPQIEPSYKAQSIKKVKSKKKSTRGTAQR